MIKNLEVKRLSCIFQVGTKCNDKDSPKRETEGSFTQRHGGQDNMKTGKGRSDIAISQATLRQTPEAGSSKKQSLTQSLTLGAHLALTLILGDWSPKL